MPDQAFFFFMLVVLMDDGVSSIISGVSAGVGELDDEDSRQAGWGLTMIRV